MSARLPTETPVLIFGSHLAALGVLRILAGHGVRCFVVDDTTSIITRSRWYRPTTPRLPESRDPEALADFLRSLDIPRAVLIPCSDQWALAVAGLPPDLRERFPASVPSADVIAQFTDKARFGALVGRLGIAHPRSLAIHEPSDLDALTDEELRHGFLKPTDSQRHNRRFGTKGAFVSSRAEASDHVRAATESGIDFMFQEWIPGPATQHFNIDGFVTADGTIPGILARRRLRMYPPRLANTCADVTIPLSTVDAVLDPIRTMFRSVGYRGIFNIEFKLDPRDGRWNIIEVNARPFWMIAHIARAGIDLPLMAYLDAQGIAIPAVRSYQIGRYGHYELQDASSIAHAWAQGRRGDGSILRSWIIGDRALFWWRDPMPALAAIQDAVSHRIHN